MDQRLAVDGPLPERLNFSIGHTCWVECRGCYSVFGKKPPDLERLATSAEAFVQCGVRAITLSGGDPLRIPGILNFLDRLRAAGMQSIKLDTVGTALLPSAQTLDPRLLCRAVDILGLPLDGWDEASVGWFRSGRSRLFAETVEVLEAVDATEPSCAIYINTVLHATNVSGLRRIFDVIKQFRSVRHWNIFQYTPTDQADERVNRAMAVSDERFREAAQEMLGAAGGHRLEIEFASNTGRLGKYFLVNSDGDAWIPDLGGVTVRLGTVFGREHDVLDAWRQAAARVTS
jgi:MoaA/NifB/PqqE/SkfB family radical SAM enzyme